MTRLNQACLLFGLAFGFLFAAAGFGQYNVIHHMLLLQNAAPFLIMGTSMATSLPLLWLLERRRWHTPLGGPLTLRRWPIERKHLLGGVVFGTGWAITGACPGTLTALIGTGSLLGVVLLVGVVAGIALRDAVADTQPAANVESAPMEPSSEVVMLRS